MSGRSMPVAFLVAVGFVAYDEIRNKGHLPPYPQRFAYVGIVYVILAVLAVVDEGPAAVLAWGFILALAYQAAGADQASTDVANDATSTPVTATAGTVIAL